MIINKPFIDEIIYKRNKKNDPVRKFSVRNKASPINEWEEFQTFNLKEFNLKQFTNIDGVKLKFRHTTLLINGRHKNY